jgi:hypothetical protein
MGRLRGNLNAPGMTTGERVAEGFVFYTVGAPLTLVNDGLRLFGVRNNPVDFRPSSAEADLREETRARLRDAEGAMTQLTQYMQSPAAAAATPEQNLRRIQEILATSRDPNYAANSAQLDRSIQYLNTLEGALRVADTVVGTAASFVPYGGPLYSVLRNGTGYLAGERNADGTERTGAEVLVTIGIDSIPLGKGAKGARAGFNLLRPAARPVINRVVTRTLSQQVARLFTREGVRGASRFLGRQVWNGIKGLPRALKKEAIDEVKQQVRSHLTNLAQRYANGESLEDIWASIQNVEEGDVRDALADSMFNICDRAVRRQITSTTDSTLKRVQSIGVRSISNSETRRVFTAVSQNLRRSAVSEVGNESKNLVTRLATAAGFRGDDEDLAAPEATETA